MPELSDIREFARRRWDLVADEKLRFLAERYRRGGPAAARTAARRLAERFRRLHPEGPSAESRTADLAAHVALKQRLDLTAHVVTRR